MEKLKKDELNKVSGGVIIGKDPNIECHKGQKVDKYNVVVGKKYVAHDFYNTYDPYYVGICTKTYEKDELYGTTIRTHVLKLDNGTEKEINSKNYTMYEYI